MGIQGLIPFLKKSSRPAKLSEFRGKTAAIDAYCWLHKGAFSCAEKLVRGEPTDGYIIYVMKQVNLLLSYNIKPILVFDGCHLPAKEVTELKRRESREKNRRKAKELLREGKTKEARECFQRCVDVTSAMARDVIKVCRSRNIDTIVAPYEADSQLAFLNLSGLADFVITEDSDLILFGCDKIIFKLDSNGGGMLVEKEKLHLSMNVPRDKFDFARFRNMCVLSGCDYLPSLHGIGLAKACRFFIVTSNPDVFTALCKLPANLKMPHLEVTLEYRKGFLRAVDTLLHQLVFDPTTRTLIPLNPYPEGATHEDMPFCGAFLGHRRALQIALGNIDVQTGQVVDDFDPDTAQKPEMKSSGWAKKGDLVSNHPSIWKPDFLLNKKMTAETAEKEEEGRRRSSVGAFVAGGSTVPKEKERVINVGPSDFKRKREEGKEHEKKDAEMSENLLQSIYSTKKAKVEHSTGTCVKSSEDVVTGIKGVDDSERKVVSGDCIEGEKITLGNEDFDLSKLNEGVPLAIDADGCEEKKDQTTDVMEDCPLTGPNSSLKSFHSNRSHEVDNAPTPVMESPTSFPSEEKVKPKGQVRNPFAKRAPDADAENVNPMLPSKFSALHAFSKISPHRQRTIVCSRYFKPAPSKVDTVVKSPMKEQWKEGTDVPSEKIRDVKCEVADRVKSPLKPNNITLPTKGVDEGENFSLEKRTADTTTETEEEEKSSILQKATKECNRTVEGTLPQSKGNFNWKGRLSASFSFRRRESFSMKEKESHDGSPFSLKQGGLETPPASQPEFANGVNGSDSAVDDVSNEINPSEEKDLGLGLLTPSPCGADRLTPPSPEVGGDIQSSGKIITKTINLVPAESPTSGESFTFKRKEALQASTRGTPKSSAKCRVSGLRKSTANSPSSPSGLKQRNLMDMFAFKRGKETKLTH